MLKWDNMSQAKFAQLFEGVTRNQVNTYANGMSSPSVPFMIRLSHLTNIGIEDLYYNEISPSRIPDQPILNPSDQESGGDDKNNINHQVSAPNSSYLEDRVARLEEVVNRIEKKIFE